MAGGDVNLYDVNAGFGRDGGPYMDDIEREQAEIRRAAIEGREPDLANPGPTAGTVLVSAQTLIDQYNPVSHPSQQDRVQGALAGAVDVMADDPNHELKAVAVIPAEVVAAQSSNQQKANEGSDTFESAGGETIGQQGTVTDEVEPLSEHDTSSDLSDGSAPSGVSDPSTNGTSDSVVEGLPPAPAVS